mmetsp:Transcript_12998/g.35396  ORF Transcript_12998/g.35396 Transcript_12998/m.35396 type:complete len:83 (-) Transcript_12998:30-278(-)
MCCSSGGHEEHAMDVISATMIGSSCAGGELSIVQRWANRFCLFCWAAVRPRFMRLLCTMPSERQWFPRLVTSMLQLLKNPVR